MKALRPVLRGIKTCIPFTSLSKGTGGTSSARYCYSVWLRHLYIGFQNGLNSYPKSIAELGPGDSIGIGLAGLIGGAKHYYALDVVEHAINERNMAVFEKLVALFNTRADIPNAKEFPNLYPRLESYDFLHEVFSQDILSKELSEYRINNIRKHLLNIKHNSTKNSFRYICPWSHPEVVERESVDMIFSQAVLEHVDDLEHTYRALYQWLRKGGLMSHQIDFKSHGLAKEWNGHWAYSDAVWRLIRGNRPYLLNREPLSTHIRYLEKTGFKISCVIPVVDTFGLSRNLLSSRFKKLSNEDLTTSSAHIISTKN